MTSIGENAFYKCSNLTSVDYNGTIDDWVQISFGDYDANPLYYAKNLYINNELVTEAKIITATKISARAFSGCSSLTSIEIPDSVTSIGWDAFKNCSSLTSVYYNGSIDDWAQIVFGNATANPLCYAKNLYIDNELVTEAKMVTATKISARAFVGCSNLTSIEIPDSVTSIGENAFYECSNLTSVVIGNGATSIGEYAFYNCSSLTSVVIGNSVTSIGYSAFYHCSNLTEVYYHGTESEWDEIGVCFSLVKLYYYSETKPSISGNYWHYVDGVVTKW